VYAVCSLQSQEGPDRIAAARKDHSLEIVPVAPGEIPGLDDAIAADGTLRTLPCLWADAGGMDGFYIARLRRCG
jgi:16S rRNA (cytosine967-C5)-methyltransferase